MKWIAIELKTPSIQVYFYWCFHLLTSVAYQHGQARPVCYYYPLIMWNYIHVLIILSYSMHFMCVYYMQCLAFLRFCYCYHSYYSCPLWISSTEVMQLYHVAHCTDTCSFVFHKIYRRSYLVYHQLINVIQVYYDKFFFDVMQLTFTYVLFDSCIWWSKVDVYVSWMRDITFMHEVYACSYSSASISVEYHLHSMDCS